ncbi:hypothetical protein GF312_07290 [Candidatus Poribacteria bacterium]|nr:hypothetical protein [Candidatus Poribacteria bacterium]
MLKTKIYIFSVIIFTILIFGCTDDSEENIVLPSLKPYDLKIIKGWLSFQDQAYEDAVMFFHEAKEIDPLNSTSHIGLGWGYAMTGQMEKSISSFQSAIERDSGSTASYSGKAFVYLAQRNYKKAISNGYQAVLLGGENYSFQHLPQVNYRNLRLLMAESYYALGQYDKAQNQIDIIDPENDLDPNKSDYVEKMILKIENLGLNDPILTQLTG